MKFSTAFRSADILIPNCSDMKKWSVVACDQYTSEPEYWQEADRYVGDAPSSLRLVLPEVYIGKPDAAARIEKINRTIDSYLNSGIFKEYKDSMICLERRQSNGKVRRGIVGAIDLEEYDYRPGSRSQIRATEATVAERIPARLEIRKNAKIELPHTMILIDDPEDSVIGGVFGEKGVVYSFDLMGGGGSVKGSLLSEKEITAVDAALAKLREKSEMLFAVGDGNHSLAAAKEHYERLKRENPGRDLSNHPARYALCEIVNLHSEALEFEAIHRIVRVPDQYNLIMEMSLALGLSGISSEQRVRIHRNFTVRELYIREPLSKLSVGSVQAFLDKYISTHGGEIDYIHGDTTLKRLAAEPGVIGFEFAPLGKDQLFPAVVADGALPRKTFSMGEAADKRYYLEARRIV